MPSINFDTGHFPAEQRFSHWAAMVPAFTVAAVQPGAFSLQADGWLIGELVLTYNAMPAVILERPACAIGADGRDDYVIVVSRNARWHCSIAGAAPAPVEPGVVCVLDNAIPFRVENDPGDIVILNVPRALLDDPRLPFDLHGQVFRNTLALLFMDFVGALRLRLPGMTVEEAPLLVRAVRDLLVTCLAAGHVPLAEGGADGAALRRARRFIDLEPEKAKAQPVRGCLFSDDVGIFEKDETAVTCRTSLRGRSRTWLGRVHHGLQHRPEDVGVDQPPIEPGAIKQVPAASPVERWNRQRIAK